MATTPPNSPAETRTHEHEYTTSIHHTGGTIASAPSSHSSTTRQLVSSPPPIQSPIRDPIDTSMMYSNSKHDPEPYPVYDRSRVIAAWTARFLSCVTLILLFVWAYSFLGGLGWYHSSHFFNCHPFFMILGITFFITNGILSWRDIGRVLGHIPTKILHMSFNALGLLFIALGLYVTIAAHYGRQHIVSLHSWIGLSSVLLITLQALGGILFYSFPIFSFSARVRALPLHAWLGVLSYLLLSAVILSGIIQWSAFKSMSNGSDHHGGYYASQESTIANVLGLIIFATVLCTAWSIIPRRDVAKDLASRDGIKESEHEPERLGLTTTSRRARTIAATNPFAEAEPVPPRRSAAIEQF